MGVKVPFWGLCCRRETQRDTGHVHYFGDPSNFEQCCSRFLETRNKSLSIQLDPAATPPGARGRSPASRGSKRLAPASGLRRRSCWRRRWCRGARCRPETSPSRRSWTCEGRGAGSPQRSQLNPGRGEKHGHITESPF